MLTALTPDTTDVPAGARVLHELETARLRLRMFTPADIDELTAITTDPEVMRYIGDGLPLTREQTEANMMSIINAFRRRGFGRWAVVHKPDGALIGYCGLSASNHEVGVELAYLLARGYWGRGLAFEASTACLRYGFETLGVPAIAALTRPDNHRSRRVMERLGMRFVSDGTYFGYSCVHYTLDRADFRPPPDFPYLLRRAA
jgi:RimJ/RimL family protein N-acetyltransferase